MGSYLTQDEFRNIVVTSNNAVLYQSDFENHGLDGWEPQAGSWSVKNGVLQQTSIDFNCFATTGNTNWANYTLSFQVRRIGADEGFFALFAWHDKDSYISLNAGGWGNRFSAISQNIRGHNVQLTGLNPLVIETGRWYDVRVVMAGTQIAFYLDSNLIQTATAQVSVTTNAMFLGVSPRAQWQHPQVQGRQTGIHSQSDQGSRRTARVGSGKLGASDGTG